MNRREFVKDSLALAGAAAIGLGCSKETTAKEGSSTPQSSENKGEKKMKYAVVYYSWSGNTRFAAETIAKKAGADLFEIKAEKPYNSDFHKCCDEAKSECYGKTLRPIKTIEGLDLAKYDVVFVGFPVWWYREPSIIDTFMEAYDFGGKTVVPFATSGSSDIGPSGQNMQALAPKAKIDKGKRFAADASEKELGDWAKKWL